MMAMASRSRSTAPLIGAGAAARAGTSDEDTRPAGLDATGFAGVMPASSRQASAWLSTRKVATSPSVWCSKNSVFGRLP